MKTRYFQVFEGSPTPNITHQVDYYFTINGDLYYVRNRELQRSHGNLNEMMINIQNGYAREIQEEEFVLMDVPKL